MSEWRERAAAGQQLRIGHRGAAGLCPENTLMGFQRAMELGLDAVELDVRRTADGVLVVIHSDDLAETTDGRGSVRKSSLAELCTLNAGEGQRIPRFDDTLEYLKGQVLVVVDVKEASCIGQAVATIIDHQMQRQALICALHAQCLREAHELAPQIATSISYPRDVANASTKPYLAGAVTVALAGMRAVLPWRISDMIHAAKASGAMLYRRVITPKVVEEAHRNGWSVGAWTVDDAQEMERLWAMRVDSITSNRADLLAQQPTAQKR